MESDNDVEIVSEKIFHPSHLNPFLRFDDHFHLLNQKNAVTVSSLPSQPASRIQKSVNQVLTGSVTQRKEVKDSRPIAQESSVFMQDCRGPQNLKSVDQIKNGNSHFPKLQSNKVDTSQIRSQNIFNSTKHIVTVTKANESEKTVKPEVMNGVTSLTNSTGYLVQNTHTQVIPSDMPIEIKNLNDISFLKQKKTDSVYPESTAYKNVGSCSVAKFTQNHRTDSMNHQIQNLKPGNTGCEKLGNIFSNKPLIVTDRKGIVNKNQNRKHKTFLNKIENKRVNNNRRKLPLTERVPKNKLKMVVDISNIIKAGDISGNALYIKIPLNPSPIETNGDETKSKEHILCNDFSANKGKKCGKSLKNTGKNTSCGTSGKLNEVSAKSVHAPSKTNVEETSSSFLNTDSAQTKKTPAKSDHSKSTIVPKQINLFCGASTSGKCFNSPKEFNGPPITVTKGSTTSNKNTVTESVRNISLRKNDRLSINVQNDIYSLNTKNGNVSKNIHSNGIPFLSDANYSVMSGGVKDNGVFDQSNDFNLVSEIIQKDDSEIQMSSQEMRGIVEIMEEDKINKSNKYSHLDENGDTIKNNISLGSNKQQRLVGRNRKSKAEESNNILSSYTLRHIVERALEYVDKAGESYLFSQFERKALNKFLALSKSAQSVYSGLLSSKCIFIRKVSMKYPGISNIDEGLKLLSEYGLITLDDYSSDDFNELLSELDISELKKLYQSLNLTFASSAKTNLMDSLHSLVIQQGSSSEEASAILKWEIKKILGTTAVLSEGPKRAILKCMRVLSYSYNYLDTESMYNFVYERFSGKFRYPDYDYKPVKVFNSLENYEDYEKALVLQAKIDGLKNKNTKVMIDCLYQALENLIKIMRDPVKMYFGIADFLQRYSAGYVYCHCISANVGKAFNKNNLSNAIAFYEYLINQNVFLVFKRGDWYKDLIEILFHLKNYEKVGNYFKKVQQDDKLDLVAKNVLFDLAQLIKNTKDIPEELIFELDCFNVQHILSNSGANHVTISVKSVPSSKDNKKQAYVALDEQHGHENFTIEEVAFNHFKSRGFPKGFVDEGKCLLEVLLSLFWDIIYEDPNYESSKISVFVNPNQEEPADWQSASFYKRRESNIEQRLSRFSYPYIINLIKECCNKNEKIKSVIKWDYVSKAQLPIIEEIVQCMSIGFIKEASRQMLRDFKAFTSGCPDLTMWNPTEKKLIFVKVKGPDGVLGYSHKLWINAVNNIGGEATVCFIKGFENKIVNKKKQYPLEEKLKIFSDLDNGMKICEASKKYGIPQSTITNFTKKRNPIEDVVNSINLNPAKKQKSKPLENVDANTSKQYQEIKAEGVTFNEPIICQKGKNCPPMEGFQNKIYTKRMQLPLEEKLKIISDVHNGMKQCEAANKYGLPRSTVATFIRKRKMIEAATIKKSIDAASKLISKPSFVNGDVTILKPLQEMGAKRVPLNGTITCQEARNFSPMAGTATEGHSKRQLATVGFIEKKQKMSHLDNSQEL